MTELLSAMTWFCSPKILLNLAYRNTKPQPSARDCICELKLAVQMVSKATCLVFSHFSHLTQIWTHRDTPEMCTPKKKVPMRTW